MIIKFAAGVKKSKEIVENWNQRFPDTKALISIVNFGKGYHVGDKIDVQCTGDTIIINKMKTI